MTPGPVPYILNSGEGIPGPKRGIPMNACRCGRGTYHDTRDKGKGCPCCSLCGIPTFECLCPKKVLGQEDPHGPFDLDVALSGRIVLLERGIDYDDLPRLKHMLLIAAVRKRLRLEIEELYEQEGDENEWCVVVSAELLGTAKYRRASSE